MRRGLNTLILFLTSCAVSLPTLAHAEDDSLASYKVKAAFVFNFLNFTTLPNADSGSLTICAVSNATARTALSTLAGKSVRGAKIVVKNVESDEDFKNCSVTFVSKDQPARSRTLARVASQKPNLTIGEDDAFCKNGGIICFYVSSGKLRFKINLAEADSKSFKFSSKLLKLATLIE